jgi:hypothetical protein
VTVPLLTDGLDPDLAHRLATDLGLEHHALPATSTGVEQVSTRLAASSDAKARRSAGTKSSMRHQDPRRARDLGES